KEDSKKRQEVYQSILKQESIAIAEYKDALVRVSGLTSFLKSSKTYSFVDQSQTNTYRYFFQRFGDIARKDAIYAIIAQDGIFTDDGCQDMRRSALAELLQMNRFINELKLFEDIHHLVEYMASFFRK